MIQKQRGRRSIAVISILVAILLLLGGYRFIRRSTPAESPASPGFVPSGDTQTHSGLTVTMTNYRVSDNRMLGEICFDKPTPQDWGLGWVRIEYNGQEVQEWSRECYKGMCPPANEMGMLCDTLSFSIPPGEPVDNFSITIENIIAWPLEGEHCDPKLIESFQHALDEIQPGIGLDCWREPGIAGLKIVALPEGMTMEQAEDIFHYDDLLVRLRGRTGPWVFRAIYEPGSD